MNAAPGHVILVGLPGAGKSVVAKAVATRLGSDCVDLDAEIERLAGRSIADIFALDDEAEFRRLEAEATWELLERDVPAVVAAGGGWIGNAGARELVPGHWAILYLRVAAPEAAARLEGLTAERPLLAGSGASPAAIQRRLEELAAERGPLYERADAVVETGGRTLEEVVAEVAGAVRRFWDR